MACKAKLKNEVVFSHNRDCDNNLWFGRLALDEFEDDISNDFIMDPGLFNYYDEVIENFWPSFIIESSYS